MDVISVKNLSKTFSYYKKDPGLWAGIKGLFYRQKLFSEAVKGISFKLGEGELVGFLGPNGAGKTTTLKMLSGILYPTSGEARVLGYVPWQRQRSFQRQIALVMGQKNQLWWDLPAVETFLLNKEIYEVPEDQFKQTVDELVALLGLKDLIRVPVRKLSLGQRMKCELIAALLHKPKVLFLDEPTIGLDVVAQQKMREFIRHYNETEKTTIILTSHYMEDIEALAKRVIVITEGRIVYDGMFEHLKKKYAPYKVLTLTFTRPVSAAQLQKFGQLLGFTGTRASLKVPLEESRAVAAAALQSGLPIDDILIDEPDVHDIVRTIFAEPH
jgi:ABC-2 type transport system ATP-binding protein